MKKQFVISLLFLFVLNSMFSQERVLVISGGGARGAWGGGLAQALYESGKDYRAIVGTSTGSLLAPLIAIDSFAQLREGYTGVTQKDIFNVNPFNKKGAIKGLCAFWRIITFRRTLGESKNLRKTIRRFFPESMYSAFQDPGSDLEFVVTVANLKKDSLEYRSSRNYAYDDMVNWMWASANQPVFMSLFSEKDEDKVKQYYVDGGIKENIPLEQGIEIARERGIKDIDVIVHNSKSPHLDDLNKLGILKLLGRTIDLFSTEVRINDLKIAGLQSKLPPKSGPDPDKFRITVYFMPQSVFEKMPNSLLFDQKLMQELWEDGYGLLSGPPSTIDQYVIRYEIDR